MTDELDGLVKRLRACDYHGTSRKEQDAVDALCREAADAIEALRSAPDVGEGPDWLTNCCQCGRVIDTREQHEGGDAHGARWSEDAEPGIDWVCSGECWDRALADQTKEAGE